MNTFFKSLFFLAVISILAACDGNDPEPEVVGQFDGGVFVSNEGNFGEGDGSLSFISSEGEVSNDLFASVNAKDLGDVVQSLHISGDLLFAVVNNSNKIEVVSLSDSLKSQYTIDDVALPRYMDSDEDNGYVTEWVSFTDPGQVTIFDLASGNISKSIEVGYGAEGVKLAGEKLFVANNFGTTVSLIDLNSETVSADIEVGTSPKLLVVDAQGDVWVSCQGGYDENWAPANDGKLVELDVATGDIKTTVELEANFNGKIDVNADGTKLFYSVGPAIYSINTSGTADAQEIYTSTSLFSYYGLAVGPDDVLYVTDAAGFIEAGSVLKISSEGSLIGTFDVGRGPNGFAFN